MAGKRFLQILSATFAYGFMTILCGVSVALTVGVLCSRFWFLVLFYILWIVLDRRTLKQGGRYNKWVHNWKVWKHAIDYFPLKFVTGTNWKLETEKNYLFICHPHGVMPWGIVTLLINPEKALKNLSNHRVYFLTLSINFLIPLYREILMALGFCVVSEDSINYILSRSEGNVAVLFPGGAAESYYTQPGVYRLVLRDRKGFIKLALRNGSNIVPIICFGEIDVFNTIQFSNGSIVRRIQDWFKNVLGFVPTLYYGRSYSPVPYCLPIHIVAGDPIPVTKNENPSQEAINALHTEYILQLTNLFEEYKHRYLDNPENKNLIID